MHSYWLSLFGSSLVLVTVFDLQVYCTSFTLLPSFLSPFLHLYNGYIKYLCCKNCIVCLYNPVHHHTHTYCMCVLLFQISLTGRIHCNRMVGVLRLTSSLTLCVARDPNLRLLHYTRCWNMSSVFINKYLDNISAWNRHRQQIVA